MHLRLPTRIRVEALLGSVSAVVLAVTLVWPDWFERLWGAAPDGGDGSAEWGLAGALAVATLICFVDAGRLWRRHSRGLAVGRNDGHRHTA